MKKIYYLICIALGLSSCNEFLNTDVYGFLDEKGIYQNEKSCFAGLTGIYDVLGSKGIYGQNFYDQLDAGNDLIAYNRYNNIDNPDIRLNNYNSTAQELFDTWTALYDGINRANDYIARITDKDASACGGDEKKAQFIGEAKALRALFYMNLVSFWGDVPLRLEATKDLSTQKLKRTPQAEVYNQIVLDLKEAIEGCATASKLNSPGRISKTTAQALLARAYVWMSGYPVNANKWEDALQTAMAVKTSNEHKLYEAADSSYQRLFTNMCSNKYDLKSRESMFEVEFYGNGLDVTNEAGTLGANIGIIQTDMESKNYAYAYSFLDGTRILFNKYEKNDERRYWNFATYKLDNDKVTHLNKKTYLTPDKFEAITDEANATNQIANAAKWRREYDSSMAKTQTSINYPVMRYSDVLLMIAEAANEIGGAENTKIAIDALNEVRKRANASIISLSTNQTSLRNIIRDERARELCYEGNRRMDLRRWGRDVFFNSIRALKSTEIANGKQVGYAITNVRARAAVNLSDKHIYFPIPERERNVNDICGQNEGW